VEKIKQLVNLTITILIWHFLVSMATLFELIRVATLFD